jgi:hypothetical protein
VYQLHQQVADLKVTYLLQQHVADLKVVNVPAASAGGGPQGNVPAAAAGGGPQGNVYQLQQQVALGIPYIVRKKNGNSRPPREENFYPFF